MFGKISRWVLVAVAGVLVIGLVGLGAVVAQGPAPTAQPSAPRGPQAACPAGVGGMGWRWGGTMPEALANALGMTTDELTQALQGGQTVADLIKAKNLTVEQVVTKLLATRQAALQKAVDAGQLTADQMKLMLDNMRQQMTQNLQNGTCAPGLRGAGNGLCVPGTGRGTGAQGRGGRWGANRPA